MSESRATLSAHPGSARPARSFRSGVALLAAALLASVAAVALGASIASAAPACTRSWDGGAGTTAWNTAANWDGAGAGELPTATDHVCIDEGFTVEHGFVSTTSILSLQSAGDLTISGGSLSLTDTANASTVASLTQSSGIITGGGTLVVEGSFVWTGGTQRGPGETVITAGATATIDADGSVFLTGGRTFRNDGLVDWADGNIILTNSQSLTSIQNDGTFEAAADAVLQANCCDGPSATAIPSVFANRGTFVKPAGLATDLLRVAFDNDGTLAVDSGSVRLFDVTASSSGAFASSDTGLVVFESSDYTLEAGASLGGNVELRFGTLLFEDDVTLAADRTFTQSSGIVTGPGSFVVDGSLVWTGGTQTGVGSTVVTEDGRATIDPDGTVFLTGGRTLQNDGEIGWTGGNIVVTDAPSLTSIQNDGTFEVTSDGTLQANTVGGVTVDSRFANRGTFVKSAGVGLTEILAIEFVNEGTVEADSGSIRFRALTGTSSGSFVSSDTGLVVFESSDYTFETGASLDANVLLRFSSIVIEDELAVGFERTLTQESGTITGAGTLSIFGSFVWEGGTQSGGGLTVVEPDATATIDSGSSVTLRGGRDFLNVGTLTWDDGAITLFDHAEATTFENYGDMTITADEFLTSTCCDGLPGTGQPSWFRNFGILAKTAGSGTTRISAPFVNEGTVEAASGTLSFEGTFDNWVAGTRTLTGGEWIVSATLAFDGADIDTNEAVIRLDGPAARIHDDQGANGLRRIATNGLDGQLYLEGGADLLTLTSFTNLGFVSIGADSTFTSSGFFEQAALVTTLEAASSAITASGSEVRVTGGILSGVGSAGPAVVVSGGQVAPGLSAGTLTASGSYDQTEDGELVVELGGTAPGSFDVLAATGAASLDGTLFVELVDDFEPAPGDSFRILTTAARTGEFSSVLGTALGDGLALTPEYHATDVTLVVTNLSISIDDASVSEGDAGTTDATFTVSLSEPTNDTVRVEYATGDITAADGDDYVGSSGTLTFDPGETTQTVTVAVVGDTLDEDDETFAVDLFDSVNAPIAKSEGIGTIVDDDPVSTVSIAADPATTVEGNAGTTDATFTVTLSPASGRIVSVGYRTANGTATAPGDYAAETGTVTFLPGDTEQTIAIGVKGDTAIEPDETFHVDLVDPVKSTPGTARATMTIVDDDIVSISIAGDAVDEGNSGTTDATFPVTLSGATTSTVSVDFATKNGSATAPDDYIPTSGTLTWAPGETVATVVVEVVGDTVPEPNEFFEVELSNAVNGVIVDPSATGSIVDDGDENGTPDYQMLISPSIQTLPPGGEAKYVISIVGVFGFDEPVTLSAPSLPAGITATFSVNPVDPPGQSILTLKAAPGVSLGTKPFVVRGEGGGLTRELSANARLDVGIQPVCFGALEGYVTDAETGEPIADAAVAGFALVRTDASGYYTITGIRLPKGNAPIEGVVRSSKVGYWDGEAPATVICNATVRVDLEMLRWRPASVSGVVVEGTPDADDPEIVHPTGPPIEGAHVGLDNFAADTSAADGSFRLDLEKLNSGNAPIVDAFLRASHLPDYWTRPNEGTVGGPLSSPIPIGTLDPNEHMTNVVIPLVPKCTGTVRGVVTDAISDLPIANATITVAWPIAELSVKTRADGTFEYPGVLLGYNNTPITRGVTASFPGYLANGAEFLLDECGETITGIAIELSLAPPQPFGTLEGHVYDAVSGDPIVGAFVHTPVCAPPPGTTCTSTDENGFYRLQNVPLISATGKVQVGFSARSDPAYYAVGATFDMEANQTTVQDFRLPRVKFARLTGLVTDAATGDPIPGAVGAEPGGQVVATTDAAGRYTTPPIRLPAPGEPGPITFRFGADGYWPKQLSKAVDGDSANPFELNFTLLPICKGATLQGTVFNADNGAPVEGASITAAGQRVFSDEDGAWKLEELQVGDNNTPTSVTVRISAEGFHDEIRTVTIFCNASLILGEDAPGTIVIRKNAVGGDGTETFAFAPTWAPEFVLADGGSKTFGDLTPGSGYSVAETVPDGWSQTGATCDDGSPITNIDVAAGETVTCTVTNTKGAAKGTIVVHKLTDPDDSAQPFTFRRSWGDDFVLKGGESATFADVPAGDGYRLSETLPDGWDQTSAACSDGSEPTAIDLAPGETVTCTFENRQLATLIVEKSAAPATTEQAFTFRRTWGPDFVLKHGESATFADLAPGAYDVAEAISDGWRQLSASCSDGSPIDAIALAAGETVTCSFVNEQLGTIVVEKSTLPSTSAQAFTFTPSWAAAFDLAGGGTRVFAGLPAADDYTLSEAVPSGWEQLSATCSDGSPIGAIDLAPGETITCSFVNRQFATVTVTKTTDPVASTQPFTFTRSWGPDFVLGGGESRTFEVVPGTGYSLAETVPAGWEQLAATCSDGSPIDDIELAPGENVTCTFSNRQLATLIVRKITDPNPDPTATTFAFTAGGGLTPASFGLANGQSRTFGGLAIKSGYNVAETVPSGWELISSTCSDGSPVTNIDLAAGETVTCTFTDRKLATLIVRKITDPNPDQTSTTFAFTAGGGLSPASFGLANGQSRTFSDLAIGSAYSVAETVPSGWELANVACSDGSPATNIDLAAGEVVTCTFTNARIRLASGAHTIGFWQNRNGQGIIKAGAVAGGTCKSATWLRQYKPFQDLAAKSTCTQVASYVTNAIKAASSSGSSMNPMLKAQMLATALSVYFSDPALGGNRIGAPSPIAAVTIDLKSVCLVVDGPSGDGTCSGTYQDASAAFGGAASRTVAQLLTFAAGQSNVGGSTWYGNVKTTQTLAKNVFDAINNNLAFGPL